MSDLLLPIKTNKDKKLKCLFCGKKNTEYAVVLMGPDLEKENTEKNRALYGIHHKCASHHNSILRWHRSLKEDDSIDPDLEQYDRPPTKKELKKEGYVKGFSTIIPISDNLGIGIDDLISAPIQMSPSAGSLFFPSVSGVSMEANTTGSINLNLDTTLPENLTLEFDISGEENE